MKTSRTGEDKQETRGRMGGRREETGANKTEETPQTVQEHVQDISFGIIFSGQHLFLFSL